MIFPVIFHPWQGVEMIDGAGNRIRTYDPRITNAILPHLMIRQSFSDLRPETHEMLCFTAFRESYPLRPIAT